MASLGQAFIDVNANTDPFARQVREQLKKLGDDINRDRDLDIDTNLSQASVARTEATLRRTTRDREVDVRINQRTLGRNLGIAGRLIGNFAVNTIRILGDFFNFGRQIGQVLGEAFGNLSRSMGGTTAAATTLGGSIVQVAAAFAALAAVATIMVGIFGVLLALIVPIVQTLQLFLALLPGLAAAAIFGFGPLILIFTNLGEALKATTEDAESFQSAIEDFGPATQGVLTSLRDMIQFFIGLREQMQESFFAPINEAINNLEQNLGPTFRDGFNQVAGAAGRFAASFIELFNHPQAERFFGNLFDLAALGFDEIGDSIINFTGAIGNLIDESMPNLRRAVDGIADTIDGWADSINEFADSPDLFDTLIEWEDSFRTIRDLMGEILRLFGNLIDGFKEDAVPVLEDVENLLSDINDFLESKSGEQFFDGLRVSAEFVLFVVQAILTAIILWTTFIGIVNDLLSGNITEALETIDEQFGNLANPATALLLIFQDWERVLAGIRRIHDEVRRRIQQIVDRVSDLVGRSAIVRSIMSRISTFASRIRGAIGTVLSRARNLISPFRTVRNVLNTAASFARGLRNALDAAAFWAGRIRSSINGIRVPNLGGLASVAGGVLQSLFRQEGGIFTRPTPSIIGEAGPEVLIPLTRPNRARDLIAASGLMNLVQGGDGASASGSMSGTPTIRLEFVSDGTAAGDAILEIVRRGVRVRGGSVQTVIGTS